eukprot:9484012-Pyramimonas_sp.AAC.1
MVTSGEGLWASVVPWKGAGAVYAASTVGPTPLGELSIKCGTPVRSESAAQLVFPSLRAAAAPVLRCHA